MSATQNMEVVRRAVEAIWNRGELDVADVLFASDYVNHHGLIPDLVRGPEAIKINVALYRTAFPDAHITVEELIAQGDMVVLCWTARSVRAGERTGSIPTRTQGAVSGMTRCRYAAGKIVESWTYWDSIAVLRQQHTIPPKQARHRSSDPVPSS